MSNPFETQTPHSKNESISNIQRIKNRRSIVFGIGGALFGCIALIIVANLEPWQFYTIRSALTGESAMSRIVEHPADGWIVFGLFVSAVFGGVFSGLWLARLIS